MNGFSRYDILSLVILSMPFDELPRKSVNAFDSCVRLGGVSTVTPTESDCSNKVSLASPKESYKK